LLALREDLGRRARIPSRTLATATGLDKNRWLEWSAAALSTRADEILTANEKDLGFASAAGLTGAAIDRLRLDRKRLQAAAAGLREIAALPDPVGRILDGRVRPNGLHIQRI